MRYLVILLLLAVTVLHQDFWLWDDKWALFGFLPVGLAWHIGISIAISVVWLLAVMTCWPKEFGKGPSSQEPEGEARPS